MKLKYIKIRGYKNLDFEMKFPNDGVAVLIGNNGSGKSNVLEAISLVFGYYYDNNLIEKPSFEYVIRYEKNGQSIALTNKRELIDEYLLLFDDQMNLKNNYIHLNCFVSNESNSFKSVG